MIRIARFIQLYSLRRISSYSMYNSALLNKFYVRSVDDQQSFVALFVCSLDDLNINRQFNFRRNVHEPLEDFIVRIKGNIEKIVSKKLDKRKKKNKSGETKWENQEPYPIDVVPIVDGKEVSLGTSCRELFFKEANPSIKFRILGVEYDVVVNCPWVDTVSLPSSLMIGFLVFPNKVDIIHGNITSSKFEWFFEEKDGKWIKIADGFSYIPTISDLGKNLKLVCYPSNGSEYGPQKEVISTDPIKSGPGPCPFEERHNFTRYSLDANSVRVVSYNILADVYANTKEAKSELFPYCPSDAMALDYRKQLYTKEILGYNADIICLQEVDEKVFFGELVNILSESFDGKFARKSGSIREGVATFYSKTKYRLIENHRIIVGEAGKLSQIEDLWLKLSVNSNICTRLTELHTSLQILLLERLSEPRHKLVVANTHLYFHPDADHLRLAQGAICMQHIEHYITELEKTNPEDKYTLIFCGDFNSTPDCGFYTLMTTNHLPKCAKDWKSNDPPHVNNVELTQRFPMASAYGTPPYTNFTQAFADCLDYIYYQHSHLELIQTVPLPEEPILKRHTAIPSIVFPSDHLALIADFQINPL